MAELITTEEWIRRAKATHGDRYDYSKVHYVNSLTKVIITCKIHGDFLQRPTIHSTQKQGCPECSNLNKGLNKKVDPSEVLRRCAMAHNSKFDYSLMKYKNFASKVKIICPVHGVFEQKLDAHIRGIGCKQCASNSLKNTQWFIDKANNVHKQTYIYKNCQYLSANEKLIITCQIHGDFEQKASHHLEGRGCPSCAKSGFDRSKPAYLYYLKVTIEEGKVLYKIGITNRTVDERFNLTDLSKIEIVKQKLYENGFEALEWETKLKQLYKEYQYKGPDILSSGNTELFTEDIIAMYCEANNLS